MYNSLVRRSGSSPRPLGRGGFTILGALVGAALLGLAVFLVQQGFQMFSSGKLGLSRRLQGDEALVAASVAVQQLEFGEILAQCRNRQVLNSRAARASVCVTDGRLNRSLGSPSAPVRPTDLEVVRDSLGRPNPDGGQCVEMLWCRHLASGRIVEVLLQGNWLDNKASGGVVQRRLTFRRTRW